MDPMQWKIIKAIPAALAALIVLVAVFSSFYTVTETEEAVVTTFGRHTATREAGLHMKLPWPIQSVYKVETRRTQKMELGYRQISDQEYRSVEAESSMITGDMNIVNIDFFIEWRISDPVKYLFQSREPEELLRNVAQSSARSVVGMKGIDDVLTTGKVEVQTSVRDRMSEILSVYDVGIVVVDVKVNDSEPPTEQVNAAFKGVETAKQEKETIINQALEYRNKRLPESQSEADRILREAEAYKAQRIQEAIGQVARFQEIYQEYAKYPEVTRTRMYWELMEDILPGITVYVDAGNGQVQKLLPLSPFAAAGGES